MATLADRNNNPGNIRGNTGEKGFHGYGTALDGQAALYNDLTAKMTGGSKHAITEGPNKGQKLGPDSTIFDLISVWAPRADHNDPASYAADVANQLGISPDTKIGTLMPHIDQLARAMANHEGYKGAWAGDGSTAIKDFNPAPFSSGEVKQDDGLNIPGLTVDKPEDQPKGPGITTPFTSGGIVSDAPKFKGVMGTGPVARGVQEAGYNLKENAVGVGKELIGSAAAAGGFMDKILGKVTGVKANNQKFTDESKINKPTNQAQSAGYIGSIIGQALAGGKAANKTGILSKIPGVSKVTSIAKSPGLIPKALAVLGAEHLISKVSPTAGKVFKYLNPFD